MASFSPEDIVLFRSDWDQHYVPKPEGDSYVLNPFLLQKGPGWPTPGIPALQLLLDRGVTTIGLDGVSVGASHDGVPPHVFGLGRGMMYVELLANLKEVPPRGAFFIFLPIKIKGGSAGPGPGGRARSRKSAHLSRGAPFRGRQAFLIIGARAASSARGQPSG